VSSAAKPTLQTADFDYELPPEFIAQAPLEPRDASRLMLLDRHSGAVGHAVFSDLSQYLRPGDLLILNNTRVIPARLFAHKAGTGGKVELLLLKRLQPRTWEVLVGGRGLQPGSEMEVEGTRGLRATVIESLDGPRRVVRFSRPVTPLLEKVGHVPLPPYIRAELADRGRYQTVYGRMPGSAAAPTAGLHFTPGLLAALRQGGVEIESITLHVGVDTFAPVTEADAAEHAMHGEWCELTPAAAARINLAKREGRRVIAVGTTSVRTLESAPLGTLPGDVVAPFVGPTSLYILPGYQFRVVDGLITNFHLPRSTLLMLVSALAGRESILAAYEAAKREGYRFYSFGDAMLIS
jgi:S-adenosylmethionine:tRNA ribosyltransferase-isomerase